MKAFTFAEKWFLMLIVSIVIVFLIGGLELSLAYFLGLAAGSVLGIVTVGQMQRDGEL